MEVDPSIPLKTDWIVDRKVAKKQIKLLIREWKPVLEMNHWTFEITFFRDSWSATCIASPEYRKAKLNFYLGKLLKQFKINYELEEFVVHEMLHCLSWDLVGMTERLIQHVGDPTGELWEKKALSEESLIQKMSDALVLTKYGMKTVPETIRVRGLDSKRKIEKH